MVTTIPHFKFDGLVSYYISFLHSLEIEVLGSYSFTLTFLMWFTGYLYFMILIFDMKDKCLCIICFYNPYALYAALLRVVSYAYRACPLLWKILFLWLSFSRPPLYVSGSPLHVP